MAEVKKATNPCHYYFNDVFQITLPDNRKGLPLRRIWWKLKRNVWYVRVWGPLQFIQRNQGGSPQPKINGATLNLKPSELVEVLTEKEIFTTLDNQGKLMGLRFIPEQRKYCGKQFKVHKVLKKIILETTGELRTLKTPMVLLEDVFCDGSAHGGCDRSCFPFWSEAWLKRVK